MKKSYKNGVRKSGKEVYKNIDQTTKDKMSWNRGKTILNLEEVFVENSIRANEYIKKIVLKEKLIKYICADCEIENEWNNKLITLELDHKNGVGNDNRICNLRFLCPNCHSQTETFRGRNINTGKKKISDEDLKDALQKSKNIRIALQSVELVAKGANYIRANKILNSIWCGWGDSNPHAPKGDRFSYHYSFRYRIKRLWSGLCLHHSFRFRCSPSSLYTFPKIGLGSALPFKKFHRI